MDAIRQLNDSLVLMITHDQDLTEICDDVLCISNKQLVQVSGIDT